MKSAIISILLISLLLAVSCKAAIQPHQIQEGSDRNIEIMESNEMNTAESSENMIKMPKPKIDYQLKPGEIIECGALDLEELNAFLNEPTQDILFSHSNRVIVYRKSQSIEDYIEYELLYPQHYPINKKGHTNSGIYRIGSWPVYTEFIDYMDDLEGLEQMLSEHDVEAKILNTMIFTHVAYLGWTGQSGIPAPGGSPKMCIWIHTDNGDYFLEDNPYLAVSPHDKNFTYDFYDLEGYRRKFGL